MKLFTLNKKHYRSIENACVENNMQPSTVKRRIAKGWTIEQAFNIDKKPITNRYTVNGLWFSSFSKACSYYKKEPNTVKHRLNKGWSVQEAFGIVKREASNKCKGIVYIITNTCNKKVYVGITVECLTRRFNKHKRQALTNPRTKLHKAMDKIGISKFSIDILENVSNKHVLVERESYYIIKYDSINKGYNTAKGGGHAGDKFGKRISYNNINFISKKALADYLKISTSTLDYRIKNNIPLDHAVTRSKHAIKTIRYKNRVYKSLTELANKFNLSTTVVRYRIQHNISLEIPCNGINSKRQIIITYKLKKYTSEQLCSYLNISKSTLFRRLNKKVCLNGPSSKTGSKGYYLGTVTSKGAW